jgi:glutamyl/glutaminyl-tRNA synthetase
VELVRAQLLKALAPLSDEASSTWDHATLASVTDEAIKAMLTDPESSIKKKDIWKVLRAMLTGGQKGPSLIETMEILGPNVVQERIETFRSETPGPAS